MHFILFSTIWVHLGLFFALQHSVQNGSTGATVRATKSRWNFSQTNAPNPPHWTLNIFLFMQFVLFWCIWDYLVALQNSVQNMPNLCKSSCHEVASEFFATNTPDPPHWTLNLRFGAFATIWVYSGPFGCLYETRCKTGRTSAKVHATKSRRNFSQRTHPIHPIRP